jgi:hypothetical protein
MNRTRPSSSEFSWQSRDVACRNLGDFCTADACKASTFAACLMIALCFGCKAEVSSTSAAQAAPEVLVTEVVQQDVPIYSEWVGSTDGTDSIQDHAAAKANVAAAQANFEQALLHLDFTKIVAPIDGIVGIAKAQVGDLIGSDTGELTSMSTLDPIRVYVSLSEQEYLEVADRIQEHYEHHPTDVTKPEGVPLQLIIAGNKVYDYPGGF